MKICNAQIFLPDHTLTFGSVELEHGLIARILPGDASAPEAGDVDAGGQILSPGWIDMQINGADGIDFTNDPTCLWQVAAGLPRYGCTTLVPTIITAPAKVYRQALDVLRQGPPQGWVGSTSLGYHFEGPFLNPAKKGAHPAEWLRLPDRDLARDWSRENGVRMVTMAPELPGALELACELTSRGVCLSAGHSMATVDETRAAITAGYTLATHLFNAMPPLDHRVPGLAAAALLEDELIPGIIVDGIHVHPDMVHLAWRMKGADGLALVTDAMAALGMPPGVFNQAGMEVVVDETSARLRNGTLAGSKLSLDSAVRNLMSFTGVRLTDVLPAVTSTPARVLGLTDRGRIVPGLRADFALVDEAGTVLWTMIGGQVAYSRG